MACVQVFERYSIRTLLAQWLSYHPKCQFGAKNIRLCDISTKETVAFKLVSRFKVSGDSRVIDVYRV